jgi:cardiolipin synthase
MPSPRKLKYTAGNRVTLLKNGAAFFPALIEAIDAATEDIRIETYIFRDDPTGVRISHALARAVKRGVHVRVLVDGFGSRDTPPWFFAAMRDAGIKLLQFRPERRHFNFDRTRLRRVHRKIALFDGKVGFVGGINLIDDLTESLSEFPRFDYAVRVEGPVLAEIYTTVHQLWLWVAWQTFRRRDVGEPVPAHRMEKVGEVRAAFVKRDNFRHRRDIEIVYRHAIAHARQAILITSPYFLPGRRIRHALIAAAARGVKVTLLLQGRADHAVMQLASQALYGQLLNAGVTIYEYERSMLHGKVAVVDDRWATVGSSNLDPFSLLLNREANLMVEDAEFATSLRRSVEAEMAEGAKRCAVADWRRRSWGARTKSWLAYGFARFAVGFIGFRQELDG